MNSRSLIAVVALGTSALAAPFAGLHAQQRQGGPPGSAATTIAAPPPTGLILGRVVDADTGTPIEGVSVTISAGVQPVAVNRAGGPPVPQPPRNVATNAEGNFLFYGLPKGSYPIFATATGYLRGDAGRQSIDDPPEPVILQDDQHLTGVVIRMWKYASIAGTLLDENGEPAVGSQVRSLRVTSLGDRRRYSPAGGGVTDDRGRYRLTTLAPGDYIVTFPQTTITMPASTIDAFSSLVSSGKSTSEFTRALTDNGAPFPSTSGLRVGDQMLIGSGGRGGPATIAMSGTRLAVAVEAYYPSTASVADAAIITLASGQSRTGVDFQYRVQPGLSVSGRVVGPSGPAPNMAVRLIPAVEAASGLDSGFEQAEAVTDAAGEFKFPSVPANQYVLRSARVPRAAPLATSMSFSGGGGTVGIAFSGGPANALPAEPSLYAEQLLSIDRDVANVEVTLRPGSRVLGKFEFHGSSALPPPDALQRVQVNLSRADRPATFIPNTATQVTPDGQFTTSQYEPGPYFITANGPLGNYQLESVTRAGQTFDLLPLDLSGGDAAGIVISFTDTPTIISGSVSGARMTTAAPATGVSAMPDVAGIVLAIPEQYQAWLAHGMAPRGSRVNTIDRQGRYRLSGLAPGDYVVAAISMKDNATAHDAAFYEAIARAGTHVTLTAGETRTVDVTLSEIRR